MPMKLIIAGGRGYYLSENDIIILNRLRELYNVTEVVSGGCATGADREGERWAENRNIPVMKFPADWDKEGLKAGPLRNARMAQYADGCICFPGGSGTNSMAENAVRFRLKFWDFRGAD